MAYIQIYGQGYQSSGDGGDIKSILDITDEDLVSIAKEKDFELDELELDDIPSHIMEPIEDALENEWGYADGERWHTFVCSFSFAE